MNNEVKGSLGGATPFTGRLSSCRSYILREPIGSGDLFQVRAGTWGKGGRGSTGRLAVLCPVASAWDRNEEFLQTLPIATSDTPYSLAANRTGIRHTFS